MQNYVAMETLGRKTSLLSIRNEWKNPPLSIPSILFFTHLHTRGHPRHPRHPRYH
jgi:hypothetical protein